MLQRLPGLVAEHRRGEAIRSLSEARDPVVEVVVGVTAPSCLSRYRQRRSRRAADRDKRAAEPLKGSRTLGNLAAVRLLEVRCSRCGRYGREAGVTQPDAPRGFCATAVRLAVLAAPIWSG